MFSSEILYSCCIAPFFLLFESLLEDLQVLENLTITLRQHESSRPFYIILLLLNICLLRLMELNEYK